MTWIERVLEQYLLPDPLFEPMLGRRRGPTGAFSFLACAELWSFRGGEEWLVTHALFEEAGRVNQSWPWADAY